MIGTLARVGNAPTDRPVELGLAKLHARVSGDDEDSYIESLIDAATQHIEDTTNRSLVKRTYDWSLPAFPTYRDGYAFDAPRAPLVSVTSITYLDTAGASQTLATSVYEAVDTGLEKLPGRIVLKPDQEWPDVQSEKAVPITIRFVAGYSTPAAIPAPLKHALLILVAHWYAAREPIVTGTIVAEVPMSVKALLAPYTLHSFGC